MVLAARVVAPISRPLLRAVAIVEIRGPGVAISDILPAQPWANPEPAHAEVVVELSIDGPRLLLVESGTPHGHVLRAALEVRNEPPLGHCGVEADVGRAALAVARRLLVGSDGRRGVERVQESARHVETDGGGGRDRHVGVDAGVAPRQVRLAELRADVGVDETLLFMISAKNSSALPTPTVSTASMSLSSGSSESWSIVMDRISRRESGRSCAASVAAASHDTRSGMYSFFEKFR